MVYEGKSHLEMDPYYPKILGMFWCLFISHHTNPWTGRPGGTGFFRSEVPVEHRSFMRLCAVTEGCSWHGMFTRFLDLLWPIPMCNVVPSFWVIHGPIPSLIYSIRYPTIAVLDYWMCSFEMPTGRIWYWVAGSVRLCRRGIDTS